MAAQLLISLTVASALGLALTVLLLRPPAFLRRFEVPPQAGNLVLIVASALGLFLELLLIRWVSSEIRIFAYLKNFVLIACFLGFGLGFYLCRRSVNVLQTPGSLLYITLLIVLPLPPLRAVVEALPVLLGASSEVQLWGVGSASLNRNAFIALGYASALVLPLFALIAIAFIPFGQMIGFCLERAANGIRAYSANVVASLVGILAFTALSFAHQPPLVWLGVAGLMAVLLFWRWRKARLPILLGFGFCVMAVAMGRDHQTTYWSPYQKLSLRPVIRDGELIAYDLLTNATWYQKIVNLSPEFIRRHPELVSGSALHLTGYDLPYRFADRLDRVLILGSGMGNDVAAALRNRALSVTAVEIDPLIVQLGRELHFERPYSSPRVEVIVDDARSYIQNSRAKYNLIVFSLLDSHTTSSHFSNIRIDNYVYTVEAMERTKDLLAPGGVLIVKFQSQRPWITGRLFGLLATAFGRPPVAVEAVPNAYTSTGVFFVSGAPETIMNALRDPDLRSYVSHHSVKDLVETELTTDDWPYFYQRRRELPLSISTISILLLSVLGIAAGLTRTFISRRDLHFFFLGAGFLLLESQIVSRMALLFGTTWTVNAIVVGFILVLIVFANITAEWFPRLQPRTLYIGLVASMLIVWLIPLSVLFLESMSARVMAAGLVLCSPIYFASIIFVRSFAAAEFRGSAMGANLVGALLGGLMESFSLWAGLRALVALALVLYLLSLLYLLRSAALRPLGGDLVGER